MVVFGGKCGVCGRGRCGVRGGNVLEGHHSTSRPRLGNARVKGDEEDASNSPEHELHTRDNSELAYLSAVLYHTLR